jgi:SAM-dependent methyltransferase
MAHTYQEFDWYQTPLYYDMVFESETRSECDFLDTMYRRYTPGGGRRVLEPACGSGRLVAGMAGRGFQVTGFDISDGALAFARQRLGRTRRACVVSARMESFELGRGFDMAHCLVSSFKYLLTEEHARAHLERVAAALVPGGVYVLGFDLSQYDRVSISRERWVAHRHDITVVSSIQTWPPERRRRREKMRCRLVVERAGEVKRYQTSWEFRTYSARQFQALLAAVPGMVHVDTYDFDYDPHRPRVFGKERLDQVVILQKQ